MTKPRKQLNSLETTPYYHCTSRCVRRAFLCGRDALTGKSFEHRRQWIEDRLLSLGQIFAIDICAYAVMSNHYHLVLHINAAAAGRWSDREVCKRWHQLYNGTPLTQKYLRSDTLSETELDAVKQQLTLWRVRLRDISWFMRNLNEVIARQANKEDECSGRFWEARFTSQALLDEKALLACMAYVDLNPVRAKMAKTPETSEHTSIKRRLDAVKDSQRSQQPAVLFPFTGVFGESTPKGLPYRLIDYLNLVDWTGRSIRQDKHGHIVGSIPPILDRLDIETKNWLYLATKFESRFKNLVGGVYALKKASQRIGYRRIPGMGACLSLLR